MRHITLWNRLLVLMLAGVVFLHFTFPVYAARLYFDPAGGEYARGNTFVVKIRVDSEGECINAIDARLRFSTDVLEVVDFSRGESILTLWVQEPVIDEALGTISFIGGVPGGYCGKVSGDTGDSNILGQIIFRIPGFTIGETMSNNAFVEILPESSILLSDGLGTPASVRRDSGNYAVLPIGELKGDEWKRAIRNDAIAPEAFTIVVQQDTSVFSGDFFVVFSTTDKQTGLDHYEVMESDENAFDRSTREPARWIVANSPYRLQDQGLRSIIKVKAIDKAGNETIAEFVPETIINRIRASIGRWKRNVLLLIFGAGLVVIAVTARVIYRVRKHHENKTD